MELIPPHFLSGIGGRGRGDHAADHVLRVVDRRLDMLDGQRNLVSELWQLQMDADCRCMLRILHLKCGSDRRIC